MSCLLPSPRALGAELDALGLGYFRAHSRRFDLMYERLILKNQTVQGDLLIVACVCNFVPKIQNLIPCYRRLGRAGIFLHYDMRAPRSAFRHRRRPPPADRPRLPRACLPSPAPPWTGNGMHGIMIHGDQRGSFQNRRCPLPGQRFQQFLYEEVSSAFEA